MPVAFSRPDTWAGGFYELAMQLGSRSDERLLAALQTLWALPDLEGCYLAHDREPECLPKVAPRQGREAHLYGIASLPGGQRVACGTCAVREEVGSDWLVMYLPLGGLAHVYPVGAYPFGSGGVQPYWQPELDGWLAGVGREVYALVPFELALIGFEASGEHSASGLRRHGIPEQRFLGLLWPVGASLDYYPANRTG